MLKLSRAMVGHCEAKHQGFKRVLASYVFSIWGSNARIEATLSDQLRPSFAILGPVKAPGSYSSASWGKVGDLEGREVMLKLSWAM